MSEIRSFSGTHAFDREHVAFSIQLDWMDQGDFTETQLLQLARVHTRRICDALDSGNCPRCGDDLDPTNTAGSRITTCRCIPICPECGADEAYQPLLGRPMSRLWEWPIGKGARTRRRNKVLSMATVTTGIVSGNTMITPDGASELKMRPHPGGWVEYGMDEEVTDV